MNTKQWLERLVELHKRFDSSRGGQSERDALSLLIGYIASAEFVLEHLDEGHESMAGMEDAWVKPYGGNHMITEFMHILKRGDGERFHCYHNVACRNWLESIKQAEC